MQSFKNLSSCLYKYTAVPNADTHTVSSQEKEDVLLSTWTRHVQSSSVGCFLQDAPMGLQGDTPWTLEQLVALLTQIHDSFTPPLHDCDLFTVQSGGGATGFGCTRVAWQKRAAPVDCVFDDQGKSCFLNIDRTCLLVYGVSWLSNICS